MKFKAMPENWYSEEIPLVINRLNVLALLSLMGLALRHPEIPETTSNIGKSIGRQFLQRLLTDGLEMPEEVENVYRETFELKEE